MINRHDMEDMKCDNEVKEAWELSAVDNMQRIKEKTDIEKLERLEKLEKLEKVKDRKPNC